MLARFSGLLSWVIASTLLAAADRPNIVLVLCDDLRADALGCMGHPWAQTPNIDQLSVDGVTFDRAFAVSAISVTSRGNLLTGQYAALSKWRHGDFRGKELTASQLRQTYLSKLKLAGYRVNYVGKWGIGTPPRAFFDQNLAFGGEGHYQTSEEEPHLTAATAAQAVSVIQNGDGRPFFLGIGFKAPQAEEGKKPLFYPYDVNLVGDLYTDILVGRPSLSGPDYFNGLPDFMKRSLNREHWGYQLSSPELFRSSVKGYHRLVAGVDHAVGQIVDALEESGQMENTVMIFTSVHGTYLGTRGFAGAWLPHEPSIAIPLIIVDPRLPVTERGRRNEFALTIDLASTILELAGTDPMPGSQGKSLLPILEGGAPEDWRDEFFYEHYFMPFKIPATEAVRTERWKYIRYMNSDPLFEELYDLSKDPLEERNLIGNVDYAFVHRMMEKKWLEHHEKVKLRVR
tara:strand:- start:2975 stop:4345 length:1371 start_codon:yes stop_codon:yes gene_type:complete